MKNENSSERAMFSRHFLSSSFHCTYLTVSLSQKKKRKIIKLKVVKRYLKKFQPKIQKKNYNH